MGFRHKKIVKIPTMFTPDENSFAGIVSKVHDDGAD